MDEFQQVRQFNDRDTAFSALQEAGFRLWQWMDHVSAVWWGSGRSRVLVEEAQDGSVTVTPLSPLSWDEIRSARFTVANDRMSKMPA